MNNIEAKQEDRHMNKKRKYLIWIGIIVILVGGFFVLDSILFDGIRARHIQESDFQGEYFADPGIEKKPTIILIGGGHWGNYWGNEFALNGYVGLSLPYYRAKGLPDLMEEIPLEYFKNAINWLRQQPEVDQDAIILMGASRNAELSLTIAAYFPELVKGVIAYAPSSVSWSNTVLPFNSDIVKPSWTFNGEDVPYIPMEKISGADSKELETLPYWNNGLDRIQQYENAEIRVEKIGGSILLLSGKDDKVWPSAYMSDMIEKRINENDFKYGFYNIQYENAGHLISRNAQTISSGRIGSMNLNGKDYEFEFGGTIDGDLKAITNSYEKIFSFLKEYESK